MGLTHMLDFCQLIDALQALNNAHAGLFANRSRMGLTPYVGLLPAVTRRSDTGLFFGEFPSDPSTMFAS